MQLEKGKIQKFRVRVHEMDHRQLIKVPSLIQLMQEVSFHNAKDLKVSFWDLEDQHLTWVLLKQDIKIVRLPRLDDVISIATYPSGFEKVFAFRDFRVFDATGEQIVSSSSTWVLMNTQSRRMQRIPEQFFNITEEGIEPLPRVLPTPIKSTDPQMEESYRVGWYDLDWNGHANNSLSIRRILETLPLDHLKTQTLSEARFTFKSESLLHDQWKVSMMHHGEDNIHHTVTRDSDQKVITQAITKWS